MITSLIRGALTLGVVAALVGVGGTATAIPTPPKPIKVAVAGDSTSAALSTWRGKLGRTSLQVGGFSQAGYTSSEVLARLKPAPTARVLVVMIGINDIAQGESFTTMASNVRKIVSTVDAERVFISATAPSDWTDYNGINRRDLQNKWNAHLKRMADKYGWTYGDPYAELRTSAGGWIDGYSLDHTHPRPSTATPLIAKSMRAWVKLTAKS